MLTVFLSNCTIHNLYSRILSGAALYIQIKTLFGPLYSPVMIPAEERSQQRRKHSKQKTVGINPPFKADMDAVTSWDKCPYPPPGKIALYLNLKLSWRFHTYNFRGKTQMVG